MTWGVAATSWPKETRRSWSWSINETDSSPLHGAHRIQHWQPADDLPAAAPGNPDGFLYVQQPPVRPDSGDRPRAIKGAIAVGLDRRPIPRPDGNRCHRSLRRVPIGTSRFGETSVTGVGLVRPGVWVDAPGPTHSRLAWDRNDGA